MASTYEDQGPIPWYRTEQCIFYIVFFIVFPFFFVNIFVALIIVTFNELGEAELEDDMDKNQKSCIDFAIQAQPMQLYVPSETSGLRYCAYSFYFLERNIYPSDIISGVCAPRPPLKTSFCFWSSWTRCFSCSSLRGPPWPMWMSSAPSTFSLRCCSQSRLSSNWLPLVPR